MKLSIIWARIYWHERLLTWLAFIMRLHGNSIFTDFISIKSALTLIYKEQRRQKTRSCAINCESMSCGHSRVTCYMISRYVHVSSCRCRVVLWFITNWSICSTRCNVNDEDVMAWWMLWCNDSFTGSFEIFYDEWESWERNILKLSLCNFTLFVKIEYYLFIYSLISFVREFDRFLSSLLFLFIFLLLLFISLHFSLASLLLLSFSLLLLFISLLTLSLYFFERQRLEMKLDFGFSINAHVYSSLYFSLPLFLYCFLSLSYSFFRSVSLSFPFRNSTLISKPAFLSFIVQKSFLFSLQISILLSIILKSIEVSTIAKLSLSMKSIFCLCVSISPILLLWKMGKFSRCNIKLMIQMTFTTLVFLNAKFFLPRRHNLPRVHSIVHYRANKNKCALFRRVSLTRASRVEYWDVAFCPCLPPTRQISPRYR